MHGDDSDEDDGLLRKRVKTEAEKVCLLGMQQISKHILGERRRGLLRMAKRERAYKGERQRLGKHEPSDEV